MAGTVSGQWQAAPIGVRCPAGTTAAKAVRHGRGQRRQERHRDLRGCRDGHRDLDRVEDPAEQFHRRESGKVKKLIVGVGDPARPAADGAGRIYVDDIRVTKP